MCYSSQIEAEYKKYLREFGAKLTLREYVRLYWERRDTKKVRIPRAIDLDFLRGDAHTDDGKEIQRLIREYDAEQITKLEQDLFKQKKRLADAERALQTKTTKKAQEDQRIATDKIEWAKGKLAALKRTEPAGEDWRIFPGWYCHVMVSEGGQRVVRPMRYQCRPTGKPAFYDTKFPGTYNARRDNLEKFWKGLFGVSHGIMVADAFYENVERHDQAGKPYNEVLEFKPRGMGTMLVACPWSHWKEGDDELLSFAAITDEPQPEVAAAGHDRCIIPIKPENIDAWLNPEPGNLDAMYAILDDRERPYYEHRLAA